MMEKYTFPTGNKVLNIISIVKIIFPEKTLFKILYSHSEKDIVNI